MYIIIYDLEEKNNDINIEKIPIKITYTIIISLLKWNVDLKYVLVDYIFDLGLTRQYNIKKYIHICRSLIY